MDYALHYNKLINKVRTRECIDNIYYETHHIVPRCMGGNDSLTNLVRLTPEEHYLAHLLLVKMYPNNDSLVYAANKMTVQSPTQKRNNKRYGWLKRKYQSVCKKRVGDKNPSYGKSWYYDPVTLSNGKFSFGEEPVAWIKGRTPPYSTVCEVCRNKTHRVKARWCAECRPIKKQTTFSRMLNVEEVIHEIQITRVWVTAFEKFIKLLLIFEDCLLVRVLNKGWCICHSNIYLLFRSLVIKTKYRLLCLRLLRQAALI